MREILNNDYNILIESDENATYVLIERRYSYFQIGDDHRQKAIDLLPAAIKHVDGLLHVENQKRISEQPQNTAMALGRKLLGFKPTLKLVRN
jgi:hypothetical protein